MCLKFTDGRHASKYPQHGLLIVSKRKEKAKATQRIEAKWLNQPQISVPSCLYNL